MKRSPAPQSGASSRLLNRTPTAFPPASSAVTTKAANATRSPSELTGERYTGTESGLAVGRRRDERLSR